MELASLALSTFVVGVGGGLGAMARYLLGQVNHRSSFPLMTFVANTAGSLLIGLFAGVFAHVVVAPEFVLLFETGICGGLTTVSTFSLELLGMAERGDWFDTLAYGLGTALVSVVSVACGLALAGMLA